MVRERQRQEAPRGRDGCLGVRAPQRVAGRPCRAAGRAAVLCDRWRDAWSSWRWISGSGIPSCSSSTACAWRSLMVRCEPASDPGRLGGRAELGADPGGRARSTSCRAPQHTKQRTDGQSGAQLEPRVEVLPRPPVHADLATFAALSVSDRDRARVRSRSLSVRVSASLIRSPARHSTTITPRSLTPSGLSPAARMTVMISSTVGGSGG